MPRLPAPFSHRFHDLGAVVDELHALFAAWAGDGTFAGVLEEHELFVLQLAVHEWVANLVQHAEFGARRPEIALTLSAEAGGLRCEVEDNSDGFDLLHQLDRQEALLAEPEPSERGRGLLMMIACAEDLRYEPTDAGRQRLAFLVRAPDAPGGAPLFPSPDALDGPLGEPFGDPVAGDAEGDGVPYPAEPVP